jgi:hypothetical protein
LITIWIRTVGHQLVEKQTIVEMKENFFWLLSSKNKQTNKQTNRHKSTFLEVVQVY